jgi:hypothetical protein
MTIKGKEKEENNHIFKKHDDDAIYHFTSLALSFLHLWHFLADEC